MKKFLLRFHSVSTTSILKTVRRKKIYLLAFILLLAGYFKSHAQIIDDGNLQHVGFTGSYQDLVIPNNPLIIKIGMHL